MMHLHAMHVLLMMKSMLPRSSWWSVCDQEGVESFARHTIWAMPIKDPKH